MSKYLCTVTGKYGDAIWQLATAKLIAETVVKDKVDIGLMEPYGSLIPLLGTQPWIDTAEVVKGWKVEGSPYGDQPWQAPLLYPEMYEKIWHLGFRGHPGINAERMPLIDFVAWQQGLKFSQSPAPWLLTQWKIEWAPKGLVAYAFNGEHVDLKAMVIGAIAGKFETVDVTKLDWYEAAYAISQAACFVGDRSSNKVLAHAVGQKYVICYEPNPSRNKFGQFGDVFGFPYGGEEVTWKATVSPEQAAAETLIVIEKIYKEKANGNS